MEISTLRTTSVTIPGTLPIEAYLAQPVAAAPCPAVIVISEIFGVNEHIRTVTDRIAQEGYVAIAPNIFQRTAPGLALGYSEAETKLGRTHKDQTTAAQLLSDIQATLAYLRTLPTVRGDAMGTIGFCFGGHVAYLAATLPDIKVTASFYGGGIATMTPGGGAPTLTRTAEIKGKLYAFFGTRDPLIPVDQIDQVEAALQEHAIAHQCFRYPVGHGFFCDHRADYDPAAAAAAWEQVKALLAQL